MTAAGLSYEELAERVVHTVAKAGAPLTSLQIARAVGLPYHLKARKASLDHIYRSTKLAVQLMPALYPGRSLSVDRSGSGAVGMYRMVEDVDTHTLSAELARMRQIRTKVQRVHTVTGVAKDGAGLMLHQFAGGLAGMLTVVEELGKLHEREKQEQETD